MNENHFPRIKPLLSHHIHIQSLLTYQDFLKKRPKKALTFRLSAKEENFESSKVECKRVQAKLFKALEVAKPIRKIDLGKFTLEQDNFRRQKLLSTFKKTSKVKILYMFRMLRGSEKEIYIEKSLKYFKEIQHLRYQLHDTNSKLCSRNVKDRDCKYPLKYLRCCLKLQKLLITGFLRCYGFNFNKRSSKPPYDIQKNAMINNLLLSRTWPVDSMRKFCHEMISFTYLIDFRFDGMDFIQQLPNLQEIRLRFLDSTNRHLQNLLEIIAQKGILRKVSLEFDVVHPEFEKILKALKDSKLTSFSLKASIEKDRDLASIVSFLQGMNQLEFLKINISHQRWFDNKSHSLSKICEQIKKLDQLQHLKLAFNAEKNKMIKDQRLPNFLSGIYPIFTKNVRLKTLKITCNQVTHSEVLPGLLVALQPLQLSLQKLKIDIGIPSRSPESHRIAAAFASNLANIKVLELPCLCLNVNLGLDLIRSAALKLKNLEKLNMGEIGDKVDAGILLNTIEKILCKRGLKKFYCQLTDNLQKKIEREIQDFPQYNYGMKKILKANPCLETAHFSSYDQVESEVQKWFSTKPPLEFSWLLLSIYDV